MTPVQIVLLVLFILGVNAAIWVPVGLWLRRRSRARTAALLSELATSGERVIRGPEAGNYQGATDVYPQVKGNAVLVLTERRIIVRRAIGEAFDIPAADVVGVREAASFLSSRAGGMTHVVVALRGGAEVGFYFRNRQPWVDAFAALAARQPAVA